MDDVGEGSRLHGVGSACGPLFLLIGRPKRALTMCDNVEVKGEIKTLSDEKSTEIKAPYPSQAPMERAMNAYRLAPTKVLLSLRSTATSRLQTKGESESSNHLSMRSVS